MTTYELTELYLAETAVSAASSTISTYRSILSDFARSCGTMPADKALLLEYIRQIKEDGNTNNTIRNKLSIIKGFISWGFNNGYYEKNFAESVKMPIADHRIAERMTKDEVSTMFHTAAPKGTHNQVRNRAIMELAIITASRVSALCNLKRSDIDLDARTIRLTHTKRNKDLELPLTESVCNCLEQYIENERPQELTDSDYLFVGERKINGSFVPLTRQQIYNITKKYTANACGRALSPHKLRHTSATLQIESGKLTLDEISKNLGHSSVSTTQRYAQRLNDAPRKEATKAVFEDL